MLSRRTVKTGFVILRFLSKQTATNYAPLVGKIGTQFNSYHQQQCQKSKYLLVSKACYGTNAKILLSSYEEVKDLPNHPEKLLIDVREPLELKETGQIPCSINIPLGSVQKELSSDVKPETFEKRYGRKKPNKNSEIIFHCKIGKRSATAAETAIRLGYSNVKNYEGSWMDWAEREGLPK